MRSTVRIVSSLLLAVMFAAAGAQAADKFKPFKLKTVDGAARTMQDFQGKAILVSFFFPTCAFCNAEMPAVKTIADKYREQGLAVVLINVVPGENRLIADWQKKHQFDFPVLIGASQASLQRDYKLKSTPTHYLMDAAGNVLYTRAGYKQGDEADLETKVRASLGLPAL